MAQLLSKIRQTIERNQLLAAGETAVVGVSGGPDSLCLLHALCRLRSEYDLVLQVAHLHHGLRGPDADADAEFVCALASDWRLPCTVEKADVPALAAEQGLAVEEAARRARYATLSRVAERAGARTIAVGHNADDQAETVLMHWLRGSGLAGLRGMLPLTFLGDYRLLEGNAGLPSTSPHLRLIRPLLEVTRAEIEAYCAYYGLEPRFDRSNLDTTHFRNWLRHEVIPLLARHNPNVREVMRRSARVITDDYALLRSLLDETWPRVVCEETVPSLAFDGETEGPGVEKRAERPQQPRIAFDLAAWRALPTALQRSTLREAIHRLRRSLRNISFVHVEDALLVARDGTTGDQATLPRGLMLTVGYERFTVAEADAPEPVPDWPLLPADCAPVPIAVPGVTSLPESDFALEAAILGQSDLPEDWEANVDPWRSFLDAQAVGGDLALRTRRPGDRFQPLGLDGHTAKLADFLTNQKVPRAARDRLPILVGEWGIAWVCGLRVDERARVERSTERVLALRFIRAW